MPNLELTKLFSYCRTSKQSKERKENDIFDNNGKLHYSKLKSTEMLSMEIQNESSKKIRPFHKTNV